MKYILLIYAPEDLVDGMDEAERQRYFRSFGEFSEGLEASGKLVYASALQPGATATTVQVRNGKTITLDGPFAETKEQLGGFFLIEARDLDEAIATARSVPSIAWASVEIRPQLDCVGMAQA